MRQLTDCILIDLSVLHDHAKVLVRILDQLDILQRIAVDQQQVSPAPDAAIEVWEIVLILLPSTKTLDGAES